MQITALNKEENKLLFSSVEQFDDLHVVFTYSLDVLLLLNKLLSEVPFVLKSDDKQRYSITNLKMKLVNGRIFTEFEGEVENGNKINEIWQ